MSNEETWKAPETEKVPVREDSTSANCQGKALGCYAGSSCSSIKKEKKQQGDEAQEK